MCKCLNPTTAWLCGTCVCKSDKVVSPKIVFSAAEAIRYYTSIFGTLVGLKVMEQNSVSVPCGKCAACQIRKRKEMSTRLSHEASMHEDSCFLTLTYDNDHLPVTDWRKHGDEGKMYDRGVGELPESTLLPSDVQKFMKRLRRRIEYHYGYKAIRYFAVGEYGSKTHRPHYHIIIFGWQPKDKEVLKTHNGKPVYISDELSKLWKFGFTSWSTVSPYVAKYCARYVTKKFARLEHGDEEYRCPEFILQSKRNGAIGATWFDKYGEDACKVGLCNVRCGDRISRCSIPRYYWSRLRKRNLPLWLKCRDERIDFVKGHVGLTSTYDDIRRMVEVVKDADRHYSEKETF